MNGGLTLQTMISYIQLILCFITKGIKSSPVKMSPPRQNVLTYQKNQELV